MYIRWLALMPYNLKHILKKLFYEWAGRISLLSTQETGGNWEKQYMEMEHNIPPDLFKHIWQKDNFCGYAAGCKCKTVQQVKNGSKYVVSCICVAVICFLKRCIIQLKSKHRL